MSGAKELSILKWLGRINQKLTFLLLSIKERTDITEEDYALLEVLHRVWHEGQYPIYVHENNFIKADEVVTEQTLFNDKSAEPANGTELVNTSETKEKKK